MSTTWKVTVERTVTQTATIEVQSFRNCFPTVEDVMDEAVRLVAEAPTLVPWREDDEATATIIGTPERLG